MPWTTGQTRRIVECEIVVTRVFVRLVIVAVERVGARQLETYQLYGE